MYEIIKKGRDFRIIPEKFQSATVFDIKEISDDKFEIELTKATKDELNDYIKDAEVEIFGSNEEGLVYFVSKIKDKKNNFLTIEVPKEYRNIQRREYSRVKFLGNLTIIGEDTAIISHEDISAGGLKFISNKPLHIGKEYQIKINLINNLTIECTMQPIRAQEINYKGKRAFCISGKFKNIESVDRVALVQYSFKALMEAENKENER